jgi:hypothetical protein
MKAFNYMRIDMKRIKTQIWCMAIFAAIAYLLCQASNLFLGISYLVFTSTVMQGAVFTYEQKKETGFVNMLPGTNLDRATGRFMMGIFLLLYGVILGAIVKIAFYFNGDLQMEYWLEFNIALIGLGMAFMAIQNIIFYAMGKGNSQQLMSFIHIIPGFIFWIVLNVVISILGEIRDIDAINKVLYFMKENAWLASIGILVLGIAFTIAGIFIAEKIISKKDFS